MTSSSAHVPTLELPASGRLVGLPTVARLALFARCPDAAVLLTTDERLELYSQAAVFSAPVSLNPSLSDWQQLHPKVVLSVRHALQAFPRNPQAHSLALQPGQSYPRETLLEQLLQLGFERDGMPGVVVKGDTLTLYLDAEDDDNALRLEFFADDLEQLEYRGEALEHYQLSPLPGYVPDTEAWDSVLLEQLPGRIFLDAPELFAAELDEQELAWLWAQTAQRAPLSFGRDPLELPEVPAPFSTLPYYRGKLDDFAADAELWLKDNYSVTLLLRFERTGRYLREFVLDQLPNRWSSRVSLQPGSVQLCVAGHHQGGYRDDLRREIVLSEDLLYGYQGGRKLKRLPGKKVQDASQLSIGDYLIHPDHGIGRFLGLEPRQVVGVTRDYLKMQYAGEGKLYLPVEMLPMLRRHPGTTDDPPRLSTLGTNEWSRARERARANAQVLAGELLKTYAQRQLSPGVALPANPDWDKLIVDNCPFELTPDQAKAVAQTYSDMAKEVPMDRLISGDVGFGKTEVAIRAAHRAVGNSKQVAMLVPTTVLANQHYETFRQRFADLPVQVAMLSRFVSDKEARALLKDLKDGKVDIVIGTHRLLSEGLSFSDLGLLIIDEEHRFGVAQKERIKALKANLDVLSLSATPIPRTLYMSLIGLRDVSQIMTPPAGRKPIQTVLQPYDRDTLRQAVMFELERGGKVFYIHDRIGSMGSRAMMLQRLIPEARIGVAHGQMAGDALEQVMLNFERGAYDLLLSTTIVESGLDIAAANTLIIERADRLGLAQLYQLRGRVGRRQTEAWAYLFYPGKLSEQAQRRLYAIAELGDLGSGHLLAEKDMEIRGVGNLLGAEQHGHISAVSLEVYTEMLAEEIAKLKGEAQDLPPQVAVDLNLDARLSPSYIADDDSRIHYYGRLAATDKLVDIANIEKELRKQFGTPPEEVQTFVALVKLRLLAAHKGVASIQEHMTDVQISFHQSEVHCDLQQLRRLPFKVEATRYPPGFSIKKRGISNQNLPECISQVLYLCS